MAVTMLDKPLQHERTIRFNGRRYCPSWANDQPLVNRSSAALRPLLEEKRCISLVEFLAILAVADAVSKLSLDGNLVSDGGFYENPGRMRLVLESSTHLRRHSQLIRAQPRRGKGQVRYLARGARPSPLTPTRPTIATVVTAAAGIAFRAKRMRGRISDSRSKASPAPTRNLLRNALASPRWGMSVSRPFRRGIPAARRSCPSGHHRSA
jgi:hypothetical protein